MVKSILQILALSLLAFPVLGQDVPGNLTNPDDTKVIADNNVDHIGAVEIQTRLTTRLKVKNDGKIHVFTKLGINAVELEPSALIDFGVTDTATLLSVSADDQQLKFEVIKGRYTNGLPPLANHTICIGFNCEVIPGQASNTESWEGHWDDGSGEKFEWYKTLVTKGGKYLRWMGGQMNKNDGHVALHFNLHEFSVSGADGSPFSLGMNSHGVNISALGGRYVTVNDNFQVGGGNTSVRLKVDPTGKVFLGEGSTYLQSVGRTLVWRDVQYNRGFAGAGFDAYGDTGVTSAASLNGMGLRLGQTKCASWQYTRICSPSDGVVSVYSGDVGTTPGTIESKIKTQQLQVLFPGIGYRTVMVGPPDSAGTGFRELKIAN